MSLRLVLVGAVDSTRAALEALIAAGLPPVALVTLPADLLSRHSDAVDLAPMARAAGIAVIATADINAPESLAEIGAARPDAILVIGSSQICRAPFRALAPKGCIGFHPSALPKLRGRAVIPWTILSGQAETGATFFFIDDGIDTGDILLQEIFPVAADETARSLYDKQIEAIRRMIPAVVDELTRGAPSRKLQPSEGASYCARRGPEHGEIRWTDEAHKIDALIRAVGDPYPGAYSFLDGEIIHVDRARPFADSARYIGVPGQVQARTADGFIVMCGDGQCIEVTGWRWKDGAKPPRHVDFGRPR